MSFRDEYQGFSSLSASKTSNEYNGTSTYSPSTSKIYSIIAELSSNQTSNQLFPNPTPKLLEIFNNSAVAAISSFNEIEKQKALDSAKENEIESLQQQLARLKAEESQTNADESNRGNRNAALTKLEEKMSVLKQIVFETEKRDEILNGVDTASKAKFSEIHALQYQGQQSLDTLNDDVSKREINLSAKYQQILNEQQEYQAFLQANQAEINSLEQRLAYLREERQKRIAEVEQKTFPDRLAELKGGLSLVSMTQTAISSERALILTSLKEIEEKWIKLQKSLDSSRLSTRQSYIAHMSELIDALRTWIFKKESKLQLMEQLLQNTAEAVEEGLHVSFDVDQTKREITTIKQTLKEQKQLLENLTQKLMIVKGQSIQPTSLEQKKTNQKQSRSKINPDGFDDEKQLNQNISSNSNSAFQSRTDVLKPRQPQQSPQQSPQQQVQKSPSSAPQIPPLVAKLTELGYSLDTAQKAANRAAELEISMQETIDRLISGKLFESPKQKPQQQPQQSPQQQAQPQNSNRNIKMVQDLMNIGFERNIAELAVQGANDLNSAVEKAVQLSSSSQQQSQQQNGSKSNNQETEIATCGNCDAQFNYSVGTLTKECPACGVMNQLPGAEDEPITVECGNCSVQCQISPSQNSFICQSCSTTNNVSFD